MQVLVRNAYGSPVKPSHVVESFWSEDCLIIGPTFPMTALLELNGDTGLSPFLVLDAKMAFYITLLEKSKTLATKNIGPLATVAAHIKSGAKICHNEDKKKFSQYVKEYLPQNPEAKDTSFDQVMVYNESTINPALWKKLKVGGQYLLASSKEPLTIEPNGKFKIIRSRWPQGYETKIGWKFDEEESGLENFEFARLKKMA